MATFNLTPEQTEAYKQSLAGMKKIKRRLKDSRRHNKESKSSMKSEYKLELLNVIEGYMRVVLKNTDRRFSYQNRHSSR